MPRLLDHLIAYDDIDSSAWRGQLAFLRSDASSRNKRIVLHTMNAERLFETALASKKVHSEVRSFIDWTCDHEEEEDNETDTESSSECEMDFDDSTPGICEHLFAMSILLNLFFWPLSSTYSQPRNSISFYGHISVWYLAVFVFFVFVKTYYTQANRAKVTTTPVNDDPVLAPRAAFCDLPVELGLTVLEDLPFADRTRVSTASFLTRTMSEDILQTTATRILLHFHLQFSMVRLLLTATGAAITGSAVTALMRVQNAFWPGDLDFVVGTGQGPAVVDFLSLGSRYRLQGDAEIINAKGIYCIWILVLGQLRIKVMECMSANPLDAITYFNLTCVYGAWLAEGLWHGYPSLTTRGIALTNPTRLSVPSTLTGQRNVWTVLHKYVDRGFAIHLDELDAPHECGIDLDCPCALRFSDDAGCAFSRFPSWDYSLDTIEPPRTCWMLGGSGCTRGIRTVNGENVWIASASTNALWLGDMQRLMAAAAPPP
ncbi:hypothetical protein C8R46DRAFT_1212602 [Mycena filopes]|nr:hypothetical protein C8R46DRAFT_1212602 [Mycena filopes]